MQEAVIVSAVRTPVGRAPKGALSTTRPDDLAALAMEEIVLLALRAVRALEASDQQHSYSQRDQHGEHASIHRDPMCKGLHPWSPFRVRVPPSEGFGISEKCYPLSRLDAIPPFCVST